MDNKIDSDLLLRIEEMSKKIRISVVEMLFHAKSGHPGGALGSSDILSALYFGDLLKVFPEDPYSLDRDLFVLSAGHYCPAWYAALAYKGFFPVQELKTLRKYGSRLLGHPRYRSLPGIENSGGSLGQGFSIALGCAAALKIDGKNNKVFCLMGDGEQNEGQVWEGAMFAAHHNLDNLVAIIDANKIQIDGFTKDVMNVEPFEDKYKAFGWNTLRVNGNDIKEVYIALKQGINFKGKPTVIIADTIPGKGVKFLENKVMAHGKWISEDDYKNAIKDLSEG